MTRCASASARRLERGARDDASAMSVKAIDEVPAELVRLYLLALGA